MSTPMNDAGLVAWRAKRDAKRQALAKQTVADTLKRHGLALQSTRLCADPEMRSRETLVIACPACGGLIHGVWGTADDCHRVGVDGAATCFSVSTRMQCRTCRTTFSPTLALNECGHFELTSHVEHSPMTVPRTPPDLSAVVSKGGEV